MLKKIENMIQKNPLPYIIILSLLTVGILGAISNNSIIDDAYISFRYAKNFAEGKGIVYNEGEYVEGYSNLLWLLIISSFIYIGLEPTLISKVLGIIFFSSSIILLYHISKDIFKKYRYRSMISFLITFLFIINTSVIHFATTGMESSLFIFLLLMSSYLMFVRNSPFSGNIVFILLILTRNEGALFFLTANIFYHLQFRSRRGKLREQNASLLISISVLILYESWRYLYYGSLLPNTFYAKAVVTSYLDGLKYVYGYLISYPYIILLMVFVIGSIGSKRRIIQYFSVSSILYIFYLIKIGGDFMAYRLITNIFPFLLLSGMYGLVKAIGKMRKLRIARLILLTIFLMLVLISIISGERYTDVSLDVEILNIQKHSNWETVGKGLKEAGLPEGTRIAITAAGAIPYYSELYTLDMLGLTDPYISRQEQLDARPGHRKMADYGYLVEKDINFVIGHPQTMDCKTACDDGGYDWFMPEQVFSEQKVFLKLDETHCFRMFYLVKDNEVSSFLDDNPDFLVC